jgi:hypothetical protein
MIDPQEVALPPGWNLFPANPTLRFPNAWELRDENNRVVYRYDARRHDNGFVQEHAWWRYEQRQGRQEEEEEE